MSLEDASTRRNRSKSWWKQRTKMEKVLVLILLLAAVIIIGLVIGMAVMANKAKTATCATKDCVQEAEHLLSRMDTTVNPCDDFYRFSCGTYMKETILPGDHQELDPLTAIGDLVNEKIKELITEAPKHEEIRPFKLMRKLYAACMNTTIIEEDGIDYIKEIFTSLGGWPILEEYHWVETGWVDVTKRLRQHGFGTSNLFEMTYEINPKDSDEYVIWLDQMKQEEVQIDNLKDGLDDSLVVAYAEYLTDLAVLFGADKTFATQEVHALIGFRAEIAKISVPKVDHTKLVLAANVTNIAALLDTYPTIDWINYIDGAFSIPNKTVPVEQRLLLTLPDYVKQIEILLNKTPTRVQVNHLMFEVVRASLPFLPKKFRDRNHEFMAWGADATKPTPRWEICVAQATTYFQLATDALYVRKYVEEDSKAGVTEIVSHIKAAFVKMVNEVQWMDRGTKQKAIEKAKAITSFIGYPAELRDDKELETYYAQIKFDSDNILALINEMRKFKTDKDLQFYGQPVQKLHWTTRLAAITSNAVYDPQTNSIQIPSGIMQKEFYNPKRPRYMNYGGLGLVVGHELTHGFDNTGKEFDKNGNNINWWEKSTSEAYDKKAECFVAQYGNFTVPELNTNLNGESTLGENIADNGGIKEAYLAYLEWVKQNHEELPLPALNYTAKQLFWISLANAWCSKIRDSYLQQAIMTDEHSPNEYRILGGMSNIKYFADDFNCPVGSKMNPARKCQIW